MSDFLPDALQSTYNLLKLKICLFHLQLCTCCMNFSLFYLDNTYKPFTCFRYKLSTGSEVSIVTSICKEQKRAAWWILWIHGYFFENANHDIFINQMQLFVLTLLYLPSFVGHLFSVTQVVACSDTFSMTSFAPLLRKVTFSPHCLLSVKKGTKASKI